MKLKEFHSPILKRTVKVDDPDYLKYYEAALIFELNYLNKQGCSCMVCYNKRKRIKKELKEILNNSFICDK
jgi:hypothetical protein